MELEHVWHQFVAAPPRSIHRAWCPGRIVVGRSSRAPRAGGNGTKLLECQVNPSSARPCSSALVGLIDDKLAAVGVEADIDVDQFSQPLADLGALFRVDEQHHEAAAAGAQELAADRAGV